MKQIAIVTPVLDDWPSLAQLIGEISQTFADTGMSVHVIIVDDGSATKLDPASLSLPSSSSIVDIEVISLAANLGHQRAIAVGLARAAQNDAFDFVVVMDCDGEDRPSDVPALLGIANGSPDSVVLASRAKRHESARFLIGYAAYKLLFKLLIGKEISFGNFSVLPMRAVSRLVHMPELWNNLPAAVLRSRLPHTTVPTERGFRYSGSSKMNLTSLVVHGLSAISVYLDTIFVRILLFSATLVGLLLIGIAATIAIRLFTALAIPGWTSTVVGALLILLFQTILLIVASSIALLSGRSSRPIIPLVDSKDFIRLVETVWRSPRSLAVEISATA